MLFSPGAEVAVYCSKRLPDFIREQDAYKEGNMEKALQDAFMKIDAAILEPSVIQELRHIAGMEQNTDEGRSILIILGKLVTLGSKY